MVGRYPACSRQRDRKNKEHLVHEEFPFEDERHLERYVQFHQQELTGLIDHLSTEAKKLSDHASPVNKFVFDALEGLLEFIERHFTKYFDQDAKAPTS